MTDILTLAQMAANVQLSRSHIVQQDAIIVRLVEQGHDAMADQARAMLVPMHKHLALEIAMLARMEGKTDG